MDFITKISELLQKYYKRESYPQFAVDRGVDNLWKTSQ